MNGTYGESRRFCIFAFNTVQGVSMGANRYHVKVTHACLGLDGKAQFCVERRVIIAAERELWSRDRLRHAPVPRW